MPSANWARNRLIAGSLALFAARLILSIIRSGPVLVADEIGYLTNARVIAGGVAGQLEQAPFYSGGYSLLIAPIIKLSSDPTVAYHLVLALNAALAASIFPLLYLLLTRFGRVPPGIAIWGALAGSVYPAVTVLSPAALSEKRAISTGLRLAARLWRPARLARAPRGPALGRRPRRLDGSALCCPPADDRRRRDHPGRHGLAGGATTPPPGCAGTRAPCAGRRLPRHPPARQLPDRPQLRGLGQQRTERTVGKPASATGAADRVREPDRAELVPASRDLLPGCGAPRRLRRAPALRGGEAGTSPRRPPGAHRPAAADLGRGLPRTDAPGHADLRPLCRGCRAADRRLRNRRAGPSPARDAAVMAGVRVCPSHRDGRADPRHGIRPRGGQSLERLRPAVHYGQARARDPDRCRTDIPGRSVSAASGVGPRLAGTRNGSRCALPRRGRLRRLEPRPELRAGGCVSARLEQPAGGCRSSGRTVVAYDLDHYDTIGLYTVQWFLPKTHLILFHGDRQPPPTRYVLSAGSWKREHPDTRATPMWRAVGRDEVLWRLSRNWPR